MTESDVKSAEFRRFVRWIRERGGCDSIAPEVIARGIIDQLHNGFAPANCPRGDIGRCTNEDIAEGCGWLGDSDALVAALIAAGRLMEHVEHRLVIARWHELAPAYLRSNVRSKGGFVTIADKDTPTPDDHPKASRNATRKSSGNGSTKRGRNAGRNDARNEGLEPAVLPSTSLSNPSSSSVTPTPLDDAGVWLELEEEVAKAGVGRAREAILAARNGGATIAEVRQLLAEFQEAGGVLGPGALYERLTGVNAVWHQPNEQSARQRQADDNLRRTLEQRSETQRRHSERDAGRARRARLEQRFGTAFRSQSLEEQRVAFDPVFGDAAAAEWQLFQRRDRLPLELLERIQSEGSLQEAA